MKTGQSTTSFLPETENLITTSTTYNLYVAHATDGNKTGCCKGSHGEMSGSSRARGRKGWVLRVLRAINDLLPLSIRPIKSKRAWRKHRWGIGVELFTYRMYWHSHLRDRLKAKLGLKK